MRLIHNRWFQSERPHYRWRTDLIGLFCLALLLRGAMLWTSVSQHGIDYFLSYPPDTVNYLKAAHCLICYSPAGEPALFSFGAGFPFVLSLFIRAFGVSALPYLVIQIILSSLSCLLVYRLGRQIIGDYLISMTAGLFVAFSVTAISLSCYILSDSLYFFLFLLSLVLFVDGLSSGRWLYFLLSGLLLGFAVLTRCIGQFWPLPLIFFAVILTTRKRSGTWTVHRTFGRVVTRVTVSLLVCILMITAWMARNQREHGLVTLTIASAGGPANVAAMALEKQTGRKYRWIIDDWYKEREVREGRQEFTLTEDYNMLRLHARETLKASPTDMAIVYARTVWENLTQPDYLHEDLLSKSSAMTLQFVGVFNWGQTWFWLSLAGSLGLLFMRHYRPAILLASGFLYYTAMIGFTRFQGSRLFHPGFIFGALLSATTCILLLRLIRAISSKFRGRPL